jgi:hypothetical protein
MLTILLYLFLGFAAFQIIEITYKNRNNLSFIWKIWKRFRLKMLIEVLLTIFLVITAFLALVYFLPFTSYGWSQLLSDSSGNFITMPVVEARESQNYFIRFLGIGFIFLLILAFPFMAKIEEDLFRRGKTKLSEIIPTSIKFGLVHLVMGIPLAAGIALIISGIFYARVYTRKFNSIKREFVNNHFLEKNTVEQLISLGLFKDSVVEWEVEAILEVTAYHTLYNTVLMLLLVSTFFI